MMLRRELKQLRENMRIVNESDATELINKNQKKNISIYEPVADFLNLMQFLLRIILEKKINSLI